MESPKDTVLKSMQTEIFMRESGKKESAKVRGSVNMQMAIFTKEIGKKESVMVKASFSNILLVENQPIMKVFGQRTRRMAKELSNIYTFGLKTAKILFL